MRIFIILFLFLIDFLIYSPKILFAQTELLSKESYSPSFPTDYGSALQTFSTAQKPESALEALHYLSEYPSIELLEAIKTRLIKDLDLLRNPLSAPPDTVPLQNLLNACINSLTLFTSNNQLDFLIRLRNMTSTRNSTFIEKLHFQLNALISTVEITDFSAKEGLSLLSYLNQTPSQHKMIPKDESPHRLSRSARALPINDVGALENSLKQASPEQTELIRHLVNLTLRRKLSQRIAEDDNRSKSKPEIFYLLGSHMGEEDLINTFVDKDGLLENGEKNHPFSITVNKQEEIGALFGAPPGYVDSDLVGPLIRYLVERSNGHYAIVKVTNHNRTKEVVVKVKKELPHPSDLNLQQQVPPVVIIRNPEKIPLSVKDKILLNILRTGVFPVNNPGGAENAVNQILIPNVIFFFISNEADSLIEERTESGELVGSPLSYQQISSLVNKHIGDKPLLKKQLLITNKTTGPAADGPQALGNSTDFLNLIPQERIILLTVPSPVELKRKIRILLSSEAEMYANNPDSPMGYLEFSFSEGLIDFIQKYNYIPSQGESYLSNNIKTIVFDVLLDAIRLGKIWKSNQGQKIHLDLHTYPNGVSTLIFNVQRKGTESYTFTRIINSTLLKYHKKNTLQNPVDSILKMGQHMKNVLFGIDNVIDQLVNDLIVSLSSALTRDERAQLKLFLGITSIGKTETARQFARHRQRVLDGTPIDSEFSSLDDSLKVINFTNVREYDDLRRLIFGSFDQNSHPIPSFFMTQFDKAQKQGNGIVFLFDEFSELSIELQTSLFEFFREPVLRGFVDGQSRPMKNVLIILGGNASQEVLQHLPSWLPEVELERAFQSQFNRFLNDEKYQNNILRAHFAEPLLARIGKENIYFYGPLTPLSKRQLTSNKLVLALEGIQPGYRKNGWFIEFENESDFLDLVELVETEGFRVREQGASIDNYVRDQIRNQIVAALEINHVPSGSRYHLKVSKNSVLSNRDGITKRLRTFELIPLGGREQKGKLKSISIDVNAPLFDLTPKITDDAIVLVAFHEAAHALANKVLLNDYFVINQINIRPAVVPLENRENNSLELVQGWTQVIHLNNRLNQRSFIIRKAACLLAGYVGEELVLFGSGRSTDLKRHDLKTVSHLIYRSILEEGLSSKLRVNSLNPNQSLEDFIANTLTGQERAELNTEVNEWLKEAEELARTALLVNFESALIPLAHLLLKKVTLNYSEIKEFFNNHPVDDENSTAFSKKQNKLNSIRTKIEFGFKNALRLNVLNPQNIVDKYGSQFHLLNDEISTKIWKGIYKTINLFSWRLPSWDRTLSWSEKVQAISIISNLLDNPSNKNIFILKSLKPDEIPDFQKINKHEIASQLSEFKLPLESGLIHQRICPMLF